MLISTAQYTHCPKAALRAAVHTASEGAGIAKCDGRPPDPTPTFSEIFDFVTHSLTLKLCPPLASQTCALLFLS